MNEREQLIWFAGLMEGEGHFGWNNQTPVVALRMCDLDVVEKAAVLCSRLLGKEVVVRTIINRTQPNRKEVYYIQLYGNSARALMALLVEFMCGRRAATITAVLENRGLVDSIDLKELGLCE